MESPLGQFLAAIFMVKLETWIVPTVGNLILNWKSFVEDSIGCVKNGSIDAISKLTVSILTCSQLTNQRKTNCQM